MPEANVDKLPSILEPREEDIALLLVAKCHLGTKNVHNDMKRYIYTRRDDGIFIIHLGKLWEKLVLAARVIVSVEHPEDVYVTSSSYHGRRPASKVSTYLGTSVNCGRFSPGIFTKSIAEPLLLVCMDPRDDAQAIKESSKCSIPVIAFANSHSSLKFVDIAIPCNNMGSQSIGVMCWLLNRAILRLRGALTYQTSWKVIPDMFFYNEEELQNQEEDIPYGGAWTGDEQQGNVGAYNTSSWQDTKATENYSGSWGGSNGATTTIETSWSNQEQFDSSNTFGSSDKTFDLSQFNTNRDIDWAEDEPEDEEQKMDIILPEASSGWDSPTVAHTGEQGQGT